MQRRRRIVFTERELGRLIDMAAIAEANPDAEGDYQEWTEGCKRLLSSHIGRATLLSTSARFPLVWW